MRKNKFIINISKQIVYYSIIIALSLLNAQQFQDLQKMKKEYQEMQTDNETFRSETLIQNESNLNSNLPKSAIIYPYEEDLNDSKEKIENKYFAYDFFTLRDSIPFWENLPTPSNYLLGPGDELILSLWGETQLRQVYTISREGNIYDDKVGLLHLSGKSLLVAQDYLKVQFGRIYATLNGKNPSSYIDVSIGDLRSINVNFVGHVNFPGVYPVHPFSTIITGLIQAGGVDTLGTLRNIKIMRDGNLSKVVDLYDYFINGNVSSIINLRDQDIVVVPTRESLILIENAVIRPGYYESTLNESIYDIINYAGGPTYNASDKIGLRRLKSNSLNEMNYESLYFDYKSSKLIPANSGDEIIISKLFDENQRVELIGQVKNPGSFNFFKGMTVVDLLELGGGLNDTTYLKSVYLEKAEIIRRNPNNRYDEVILFNLKNMINKNLDTNIFLESSDKIVIHANINYYEKNNILILGEVNIPGSYPIIKDNESLQSIISRAGGLTSKALDDGIAIYRDIKYFDVENFNSNSNEKNYKNTFSNNNNKLINPNIQKKIKIKGEKIRVAWQNNEISLMPGDSIVVKEKTATVFVTGAVYTPGVVEFKNKKALRYYINAAGGLTELGNNKGIIILHPNGFVKPKKWYNNPKVTEGSTIIINKKSPEEPFNLTQFATNWTSIISSMITAVILSQQIASN